MSGKTNVGTVIFWVVVALISFVVIGNLLNRNTPSDTLGVQSKPVTPVVPKIKPASDYVKINITTKLPNRFIGYVSNTNPSKAIGFVEHKAKFWSYNGNSCEPIIEFMWDLEPNERRNFDIEEPYKCYAMSGNKDPELTLEEARY